MTPKFKVGDYIYMNSKVWTQTTILKIIDITHNTYKVLQVGLIKLFYPIPEITILNSDCFFVLYFEHDDSYIELDDNSRNKLLKQLVFS